MRAAKVVMALTIHARVLRRVTRYSAMHLVTVARDLATPMDRIQSIESSGESVVRAPPRVVQRY